MVSTLDVGCGDRPRGDVNVDLFSDDSPDLESFRNNVDRQRNFVQATIYHLPFQHDSFDKVLCYHLLEHLGDPTKAIKELVRVAKRIIVIVVPYRWHEKIQNWFLPERRQWANSRHLWHFNITQLKEIMDGLGLCATVKLRYRLFEGLHELRQFHIGDLKNFVIYGVLETFFPPTPGEVMVTISKNVKPMERAK